jgi:eukaryotic-like serine/threonine-protein kinase
VNDPTPPVSPRDLTGTVLANRYRILKRLGVGAMGEVYLGEHLRMGRRDAIKVLRSGMAREPEAMARFTRGARNVSRIRHPNVCQVYDFGEAEDGVLFLAMEFVDGGSLGDVLSELGPLPLERAARLLQQAAEALHAAHEQGIVHRDLKPDNLMLARTADGAGQVKVVDFDIARGPADEEGAGVTRHGFVVGTPEYMSPEQLTGDPLDRRSDVYSLALVMVRMVTGALPFEGTTAQEIMLQRLTVEPKLVSQLAPPGVTVPAALDRAIARGLARRPDDRTASTLELAREVMMAVSPEMDRRGSPSPPPGTYPGGRRTDDRSPTGPGDAAAVVPPTTVAPAAASSAPSDGGRPAWLLPAAGVGGLLVVAGIGWALLGGGGGDPGTGPVGSLDVVPSTPASEVATGAAGSEAAVNPPADPTSDPTATQPAGGSSTTPGGNPGTGGGGGTASPPGGAASSSATTPVRDATEPANPAPATPPPVASGVTLPVGAAGARDLLNRQFRLQDDLDGSPPASVHRAVVDTTRAVWDLPGLSRADSAYAAYIRGQSLMALRDSTQALQWMDRAVQLDPRDAFVVARDALARALGRRP